MKTSTFKTASIKFNFRRSNKDSNQGAIKCVIRWNAKELILYAIAKVKELEFNKETQRCKRVRDKIRNVELEKIDQNLDDLQLKIKQLFNRYLEDYNKYPDLDTFKGIINEKLTNKKEAKKDSVLEYYQTFIEQSKTRVNEQTNRLLTPAILKSYRRTLDVLKEYTKKNSKNDLIFNDITIEFHKKLDRYMQDKLNFSINTIGTHIRNLKTLLNYATEEGVNTNYEYKKKAFKTYKIDVDNVFLTEKELEHIANLDLTNKPRLDNARDLFIVGCWTGLRFSDFSKLTIDNFIEDNKYINIKTQKTQREVTIPVLPHLNNILNKYNGYTNNSLPKSISNQKLNDYIKEVCELAEINDIIEVKQIKGGKEIINQEPKFKLITTHTARRSFATNMYARKIPAITIMNITGHKTESSFLKYIKFESKSHADLILDFFK